MITFKASLLATSDINFIMTASMDPNTKILYLGDPVGAQDIIKGYRLIVAGPWVPDTTVMESDLNGVYEEFCARYTDYLNSNESQMLLATLVKALYIGKNVILFFPPETSEFKYPQFLLQYLQNFAGLCAATPNNNGFFFDTRFNDRISYLMYYYNIITPQEFILMTESMDISSLSKLIMDLCIPIEGDITKNPKPLLDWIETYKQTMISNKIEMDKPFIVGVRC